MRNLFYLLLLLLCSCSSDKEQTREETLFTLLPQTSSNIDFNNQLEETADWNIIQYLYFYNGGGVAVGDINNDQLPDLYFTANMLPDKLYLNKGNLQFEDISQSAGLLDIGNWKTGVTMADVNGDGWLDIYVCQVGDYKSRQGRNLLYVNQQDGTFEEMAEAYGLDFKGLSTQAVFFDFDRDNDLDCYLLNHSVHSTENYGNASLRKQSDELAGDRLFRNDGEQFTEVTTQAGIYSSRIGYGLGIAVSDINQDGWLDLYVSNDFHENDYLYLNNQDGTFIDATTTALGHTSTFSMGSDIADINNDQLPDILSLDMKPEQETILKASVGADPFNIYQFKLEFGYHYQFPRNMLHLNNGFVNGQLSFSEIGQMAGIAATDWSWTPLFADFDNDGLKDLFIANGIVRRPNDLDYLKFTSNKQLQMNATDLELASHMPPGQVANYAFKNKGQAQFEDVKAAWGLNQEGFTTAAAYADLDLDGDLDLITNNINAPAAIFVNQQDKKANNHYIGLYLQGEGANPFGIGSSVAIHTTQGTQQYEVANARGFQSAVSPTLLVGLGEATQVDSVVIRWADGQQEVFTNIQTGQYQTLKQGTGRISKQKEQIEPTVFLQQKNGTGLDFTHHENAYNDFDLEGLIPHQLSKEGPAMAIGDVNGDGREDLYLGGAAGQSAQLYLQDANGNWEELPQEDFQKEAPYEDVDAIFFDPDQDGDLDLYVVSGGGEWRSAYLQDRYYTNNGQGQFSAKMSSLPKTNTNGACVVKVDMDGNGKVGLFVGGRSVIGSYGSSPRSFLLSYTESGQFEDVTEQYLPALSNLGMVTDATYIEETRQLIIVGEWMPITIVEPVEDQWQLSAIPDTEGWWNTVQVADLDQDGTPELLLGNLGLNSDLQTSTEMPVELFVKDFDDNGTTDPILSYYKQGKRYTYASKDELATQMPFIKKQFIDYRSFANTTFDAVFNKEQLKDAIQRKAVYFQSAVANYKHGQWLLTPLPLAVQSTPIYGFEVADVNGDNHLDILAVGNQFGVRPSLGRYDASLGFLLLGDGQGNFENIPNSRSGLAIKGSARAIKRLTGVKGEAFIIAVNDGSVLVYE
jgi:hypothetical protein